MALLAAALGCTTAAPGSQPAVAATTQSDSNPAGTTDSAGGPYSVGDVVRRAALLPRQNTPAFGPGVEGCAEFTYVVDTAGKVEPGTLTVREGSTPSMVKALLPVLPARRYRPAERPAGRRVRQQIVLVVLKRGGPVVFSHDADLLPGRCPQPENLTNTSP